MRCPQAPSWSLAHDARERSLTLLRGSDMDVVRLPEEPRFEEEAARIGWALTSTAPTPALSDEELAG